MNVFILNGKEFVPADLQKRALEQGDNVVFSTMTPIKSPNFATTKELMDWYYELNPSDKLRFISSGHIVIYAHTFVKKTHKANWGNYIYEQGEIASTDEAYIYCFKEKKWL